MTSGLEADIKYVIQDVYNEVSRICESHIQMAKREGINYKGEVKTDKNYLKLKENLAFHEKYQLVDNPYEIEQRMN